MTAALAFIVGGGLILLAGLRNRSITEVLQGHVTANEPQQQQPQLGPITSQLAPGGKGGNRALGFQILSQRYPQWISQWHCLDSLWTQESNWNDKAKNPSSPAAGIPQDITGNFHGGARGQIIWGLDYIHSRYGSPCAAWKHEQENNWY